MKSLLIALATVLVVTSLAAQAPTQAPAQTPAESPAQAQEPAPPTFRTGVEVITVDVAVVDRNGMPVTDLHAPEFTVKIDGEVRRVVSADLVKFNYTPDDGRTRPRQRKQDTFESLYTTNITQPEGRMIMIAVDQINIRPGAARPILDAATRFLDRLNPADRVAFISFPEPGVVVDFTSDHTAPQARDAEGHRHAGEVYGPAEHRPRRGDRHRRQGRRSPPARSEQPRVPRSGGPRARPVPARPRGRIELHSLVDEARHGGLARDPFAIGSSTWARPRGRRR